MTDPDQLRAATAVGVLASEEAHLALLSSIVDVARAIFGARASSIFLLDEDTDELVFEAASGLGSAELGLGGPKDREGRTPGRASRRAPGSLAGCSPRVSRSFSRTSRRIRGSHATSPRRRAMCREP